MSDCIQINNIVFSQEDRTIFSDFSLKVPRGSITAIIGPSGCGKTTLLRLIGAQLCPERGSILFNEHNIHQLSHRELYNVRRKMGVLFQEGALFTDMNVFDNVAFPLRENTKLSEAMIRSLVLMKLERVGLRGTRDLYPSQLSGGMARRVALARTIVMDPELLMYDEPFVGQDPINMAILLRLIKELNQLLGLTSILVSHDISEVLRIADYVCLISDGRTMAQGTPQQLTDNKTPWVKQFVHGLPPDGSVAEIKAKDYAEDLLWN